MSSPLRDRLGRFLGVDHGGKRYSYVRDPVSGPVAASRAADRWVRTTCGYCSVGCGLLLGVRDGIPVAVRGDRDYPVNRGRLCPKGLSGHQVITAEGRLLTPRLDGRPATWDDALERMVSGFRTLVDRHGPSAVAVVSTGQLLTEEFYVLGKLVRLGMGLRHYDGNTTLCMGSAVAGYKLSFGTDGPPGCYEDFELADVVVLWGANIAENHPLLTPRVRRRPRPQLIVVDPRVTKTATLADVHLAVRPRGDIALLNGILCVLLDEELIDLQSVGRYVEGLEELVNHLQSWPLERAEEESGVPAASIRDAARVIGGAGSCVFAWAMGVNQSAQGTETVTLLNTLALLTGNVGRPGATPFAITGQGNAMGARETAFTASMPGYRAYDDPTARAELCELWGISDKQLPSDRGCAYPDIVNAVLSGVVKGLWVIGTNPVVSFPRHELIEKALSALELLVVQDGFETPTTALAEVVLPASIWGEKDGTSTNSERRVSRVRAAIEPPGEARSDFDIFLDIAERWGCRDELLGTIRSPVEAFEEWRRVSAGRPCDYSGMSWESIEEAGGIQWPCPSNGPGAMPAGTPRLYTNLRFNRPGGKAWVCSVDPDPLREPPSHRYPLLLNTGRTVEHWLTLTKTGRIPVLEGICPQAWVEMHPDDANEFALHNGDWVQVSSARGCIDRIRLRVTPTMNAGEVFIPFHWGANRLTNDDFDPISRQPNYKQCAVSVRHLVPAERHVPAAKRSTD